MNKKLFLRFIFLFSSAVFISIGCCFYKVSTFGGDPVFVCQLTIAYLLEQNVGVGIIITNVIFGVIFLILNYKGFGLGTIIGIFAIGPLTNLILKYVFNFGLDNLVFRVIFFFIGIIFVAFGVTLFVLARLGFAPLEGVMTEISKRTKLTIGKVRLIMDILVFIIAMILGAYNLFEQNTILSIVCIASATFLTGPLVDIFFKRLNRFVQLEKPLELSLNQKENEI